MTHNPHDELRADGSPDRHLRPDEAALFERYAAIVRRLRADDGCPWDRKQTLRSLRRYLIEESFEVLAAIEDLSASEANAGSDTAHTKSPVTHAFAHVAEELGDVVLVTLLLADALEHAAGTSFTEILLENGRKLVRRHPHVFGDIEANDSAQVVANWNQIKTEQEGRSTSAHHVSAGLPPLERAYEIQKKASDLGFDWPDVEPVFEKLHEEIDELRTALADAQASNAAIRDNRSIEDELGDILFSVVNLSRHLKTDPSVALGLTNRKFLTRFAAVENALADRGSSLEDASLEEMDALWEQAKRD
tara:strand:+ start:6276 stop:7190 length:915 start_codon:yes stop_codon:yes gene_type:complete